MGLTSVLSTHGDEDLSDVDTGGDSDGLTIGVTHTGGEPICSGTRKHLIGTDHVEGVDAHADVVSILSDGVGQMLVDGNTACLECLGRKLLFLVAHQVGDEREEIHGSLLGSDVVDADL
eukprot:580274_1